MSLPVANHAQCHLCSKSSGNPKTHIYSPMLTSICTSGRTLILGTCLCMSAAAVSAEDLLGTHTCGWLGGRRMWALHCLAML